MNLANHCFHVCSCGGGGSLGLSDDLARTYLMAKNITHPSDLSFFVPLTELADVPGAVV